MHIFKPLIHFGGIVHTPKDIPAMLGLVPADSGWEYLKRRYVKHFSGSLEVRGGLPDIDTGIIRERALEAAELALEHYGDMLVGVHVRVRKGHLDDDRVIRTGYHAGAECAGTDGKVCVDIVHDSWKRSYSIAAFVKDHVIDGVPLFLLLQLIHHHIIFDGDSLLLKNPRAWKWAFQKKVDLYGKSGRRAVKSPEDARGDHTIIPAGAFIDVTDSAVIRLRNSISEQTGAAVPASMVEEALLAMLYDLDYVMDCVSRHGEGPVMSGRYDGLGFVRAEGFRRAAGMSSADQYTFLRSVLSEASGQLPFEREGKGRVSVFLKRLKRVPAFYVNFFDRRTTKDGVIVVSGHDMLGSNLNGVDFGIPLYRKGMREEHLRFTFMPSHAEHHPAVRRERERRGVEPDITVLSFGCAPATRNGGGKIVFKSIKTARRHAEPLLTRWGYAASSLAGLGDDKIVELMYNELYAPMNPHEGRVERLAEALLEAGADRKYHGKRAEKILRAV